MRLVIALGGNALLPREARLEFDAQRASAARVADALGPVIRHHQVVLTHGNGPQVGLLALQSEAYAEVAAYPLDVLVAESEGMIGYILETELERAVDGEILTVLTRTVVDPSDPAFSSPSKPIGPVYQDGPEIRALAEERRWQLRHDGSGLRRVVPSPDPVRIIHSTLLRRLVDEGVVLVCTGGGGIPVIEVDGSTRGIEAVIDKDLASSLLACELGAEMLVCLTDVDAVYDGWGSKKARAIRRANPGWLRSRAWAEGSMGPKIEAVSRFVETTSRRAVIGGLLDVAALIAGAEGTTIDAESPGVEYPTSR